MHHDEGVEYGRRGADRGQANPMSMTAGLISHELKQMVTLEVRFDQRG